MRIMDVKPAVFVAQLRCDRCGVEAQHNVEMGSTTSCGLALMRTVALS